MKRFLIGMFGGGGMIFLSLLVFMSVKNVPREIPQGVEGAVDDSADVALSGVAFVQTKDGMKDWELRAERAEFFEKDRTAQLSNIAIVMKTGSGDEMTLRGDRGSIDTDGNDFSINKENNPVSVQLRNGYTIQTDSLHWVSEERAIRTDDPVVIVGPGINIQGEGLTVWVDHADLMVLNNVQANVY